MLNILVVIVSLLIGVGLQRVKNLPANAHTTLGTLILYVPLPAICFLSLPDMVWEFSLLSVILVGWIIFGMSYFLFSFLGRKFHWDKGIVGCLILTAGLSNSAFVGFPVIDALYGKEALKLAVLLDQTGTFLIASSLGIWVAVTFSSGELNKTQLLRKVFLFPPFLAFLTGTLMGFVGLRPEGLTRELLERLAILLTPMALISVGLQLRWNNIHEEIRYLVAGLSFKLILGPLVILILYYALKIDPMIIRVSVMESAMAPMVTASIIAASHGLRPRLAGMMVGVGVPLSFLTLGAWHLMLNFLL